MTPIKPRFNHQPLENPMKLIQKNIADKNPVYEVEQELVEWSRLHTNIWLKRLANSPCYEGIQRQRSVYIGLITQKIFEVILQQIRIPYIHNDPVLDYRKTMPFDFRIPHVGTIEVKGVDFEEKQRNLLINCTEWHHSNYCLAFKLRDPPPKHVDFIGYATGTEVERQFEYVENRPPCKHAPCYARPLNNLHSANEFLSTLQKQTAQCWK